MDPLAVDRPLAFGALLRHFRLRAELSQEGLAERARISPATVSTLERGTRQAPHRETVLLLAEALGLSQDDRTDLFTAAEPRRARLRRSPGGRTAVTTLYAAQVPQHNLPEQLSSLVGRHEVLAEVGELVAAHRLVTLVGIGGVGKTRVALQVAENLSSLWPDGVRLVELADVGDSSPVVGAIARVLGVRESRKQTLLQTVVDSLKRRRLLIVLDNCEHVIDEVSRTAFTLLRECGGVHVLATSQESLNVAGERVYRVPSLGYPDASVAKASDAVRYPAVALFVDRAEALGVGFTLDDDNAKHIGEVCRRLDGIPLAIELAAARVKLLAPRQLAELLNDRFRMLTGGGRGAPSRQQTMEAALSWSYDLLSPAEQLLFDRLSVFTGSCTLETASAVCSGDGIEAADIFEVLSSLVDKSLVAAEELADEARYRLLESSRHYGRGKLLRRGEKERLAGRHAQAYLDLAFHFESLRASINSSGNLDRVSELLDALENEQPDFTAAIAWSLGARGNVPLGQRLASSPIWGSQIAEPLRWIQIALASVDATTPPRIAALLERRLAGHFEQRHEFERALDAMTRSTIILQNVGAPTDVATSRLTIAMVLLKSGRVAEAESLAQEVSASVDELGSERVEALVRDTLGIVRLAQGNYSAGRLLHLEALRMLQAGSDGLQAAICEMNLAAQEFGLGDVLSALDHSAHALPVLRAWRHVYLAECLSNEAVFLIALDRFEEARERAFESLNVAIQTFADAPARAIHAMQRLASVAALHPRGASDGCDERAVAARLLGYADAQLTAQGAFRWPTDQRDVDRAMAALTSALGADDLARLGSIGEAMSNDEAVDLALRLTVDRPEGT